MSDSRSSSPDTIDIEIDPASRNVRQRLSPIPGDPYLAGPSNVHQQTDSDEEPFEDEDPSEDEEIPLSVHLRSPSPLPSASSPAPILSTSPPSPLPPASPPSPFTGPSSLPVPPLPTAPPSPILPSLTFSSRNEGIPVRWDWMPISIRAWRQAEQVPVIPIPPDLHTPTLTLTGEAIHHTIPVVIARLRTHDEQLEELDRVLETLPHRVGTIQQQADRGENDLLELRDYVVEIHTRGVETQDEVAALRQEVAALRQELAVVRAERDQSRADAPSS